MDSQPRSVLARPPRTDITGGRRKRSRAILKIYGEALQREQSAGSKIGNRTLKRKIIPPRERAANVLKREIYRCAMEMRDLATVEAVKKYVLRRGRKGFRPGTSAEIDWATRLVCFEPPIGPLAYLSTAYDNPDSAELLNATAVSRLITELTYGWQCNIRWELVDMFIDHVGGHELISASNKEFDDPCRLSGWADLLVERPRNQQSSDEEDGWD